MIGESIQELKKRNKLLETKIKEYEERIKMQKSTIIDLKETIGNILSTGDKKNKHILEMQLSHNTIEQDNSELIFRVDSLKRVIKDLSELI